MLIACNVTPAAGVMIINLIIVHSDFSYNSKHNFDSVRQIIFVMSFFWHFNDVWSLETGRDAHVRIPLVALQLRCLVFYIYIPGADEYYNTVVGR